MDSTDQATEAVMAQRSWMGQKLVSTGLLSRLAGGTDSRGHKRGSGQRMVSASSDGAGCRVR